MGAFTRSCAQIRALPQASSEAKSSRFAGTSGSGETRTRTGDTTIFSRVLYQLSYLALRRERLARGGRGGSRREHANPAREATEARAADHVQEHERPEHEDAVADADERVERPPARRGEVVAEEGQVRMRDHGGV